MKTNRIAASLIAVLMSAPLIAAAQQAQSQNDDWMSPPAGTEQAQAYKDGIEAAKLDTAAKRPVNASSSYLYNHPPVKKSADKDSYRSTFTQGYKAAVAHNAAGGNAGGGM